MPLYSFHCAACDKDFEMLMRFDDSLSARPAAARTWGGWPRAWPTELKSDAIKKSWRAKAAREGDLSNFSKTERNQFKK